MWWWWWWRRRGKVWYVTATSAVAVVAAAPAFNDNDDSAVYILPARPVLSLKVSDTEFYISVVRSLEMPKCGNS